MIARIWRGAVRAEDAAAYVAYVQETGIDGYKDTPGNRGAWALSRVEGDRAEIVTVSFWESRAAIEAFAGPDISRAVFYPEDDRYLIDRDLTAQHYEVADPRLTAQPPPGRRRRPAGVHPRGAFSLPSASEMLTRCPPRRP
jgi:heme-degrading monooxygenase HmoA